MSPYLTDSQLMFRYLRMCTAHVPVPEMRTGHVPLLEMDMSCAHFK